MGLYFTLREKIRRNPAVNAALYLSQSLYRSYFGRLAGNARRARTMSGGARGVALCLRFRDEARYLEEWLEYYRAAGVDHFYLYNNFSEDEFVTVIRPWIDAGRVTLVDWQKIPASPWAEEDCVRRAVGRFAWVGFLDADEFVVIRDGRSIGEFLSGFADAPAVGLHWRMFGSSLYQTRPREPVIVAYQKRGPVPNAHIKSFVRPERVAQCRNPHSFFYWPISTAVNEHHERLYGSLSMTPTADAAWINHYFCKSQEDYLEKTRRRPTADLTTMRFQHRRTEKLTAELMKNNEVFDSCAVDYYAARCRALGWASKLLTMAAALPSH